MLKQQRNSLLVISLIFVVVLGGIFFHYRQSPAFPEQVKIGATYMTMNNDFYQFLNAEVEKTVNERGDILYTRDPELSISRQIEQVDAFIANAVDVIIINPVDGNSQQLINSLKKAKQKGINIIVVDSQLKDDSFVDTTIVSDNYQAGVLCAQNMMETTDKATILLLEHRNTLSAVERIQGFLDTIALATDAYKVVAKVDTSGQTEIAMPLVQEVIQKGTTFDTVMALNDRAAIGSLAAIKAAKLSDDILIYGIDGSPDMKNLLFNTSDVQATVAQSPYNMGKAVVEALYTLQEKQAYQNEVIIPVKIVTKETILDYDLTGWQ